MFIGCSDFERQRMDYICHSLKVQHSFFPDLDSRQIAFSEDNSLANANTIVYVVNEDSFDQACNSMLSNHGQPIIFTFGPKFTWPESEHHFRSLTEILPSVLFSHMIRYLHGPEFKYSQIHDDSTPSERVSFETLRVLVAEDNLVNQKVLSRILSRLGVKSCTIVDNGAQAVEREKNEPFDVVLMDMQMPVMNGTEATRLICSRPEEGGHPRASVVFVTAHVADHFEDKCRNSGAVGFLSKPCSMERVEEFLKRFVLDKYAGS